MGSVNRIDTSGFVDGPGIRTVVFLNGCKLRCKYCHNPETWKMGKYNYTPLELCKKLIRNKNYYDSSNGGVTFSGGEPLLQSDFVIEVCKVLKDNNIHVAIDTAGVGNQNYDELLKYVDLVILDIKHTSKDGYRDITGYDIFDSLKFIECLNNHDVEVWIRQVIIPGVNDNDLYLDSLAKVIHGIKNVTRVDFLPYHNMGISKYDSLLIDYPYRNIPAMDRVLCEELYNRFISKYN